MNFGTLKIYPKKHSKKKNIYIYIYIIKMNNNILFDFIIINFEKYLKNNY